MMTMKNSECRQNEKMCVLCRCWWACDTQQRNPVLPFPGGKRDHRTQHTRPSTTHSKQIRDISHTT